MNKLSDNGGIPEWYRDRTVLITGGTGFMGKVLIEKLLRSCPDIKRIYVLCRAKRGFAPQARVNELIKLPLFERLRKESPQLLRKLVAVEGDVTSNELGLRAEQREILIKEVNVVFNAAASLRLEAGMKPAIEHNTVGTLRVLDLCKMMTNLESFVHLSTAFCHCEYEVLEESVYPSPANPHDVIRAVRWMDDSTLDMITPRLLGPHPNCYTYSKRLAESLVNDYADKIPSTIVRPSIVCPSLKEPIAGWVDSLNGPIGVMVGGSKGVIRSMLCHGENRAEVIPVDIAINAIIAASCLRALTPISAEEPTLCYNASIGDAVPLTWGEVIERGKKIGYRYPFENMLWYPNGTIRTNKLAHFLIVFLFQIFPAYLIDFIFLLARQKRFMVHVQNRIWVGMEVLQYFTMRNWHFKIEKTLSLTTLMNEKDREIFYLENATYDIDEYLCDCLLGARQYCMKEPLSSLPRCRRNLTMLYWLDKITKYSLLIMAAWYMISWLDNFKSFIHYSDDLRHVPIFSSLTTNS